MELSTCKIREKNCAILECLQATACPAVSAKSIRHLLHASGY